MVTKTIETTSQIVERNMALVGQVMHYLMSQPHLFASLPDEFELVILPDDDPEMRLYNLELLDIYGNEGKPVVFARIKSAQNAFINPVIPSLYTPIAA